jgi:hypothetical protein
LTLVLHVVSLSVFAACVAVTLAVIEYRLSANCVLCHCMCHQCLSHLLQALSQ